jgi:hypothetical protein
MRPSSQRFHLVLFYFLLSSFCVGQQAPTLRITGTGIQTVEVTAADLKQLPRVMLDVTDAHKGVKQRYEGVRLADVLAKAGVPLGEKLRGKSLGTYVIAQATDDYAVIYSLAELDPLLTHSRIILADTMDGKPLGSNEGPFKTVVPGDKQPARWVRMVNVLRVENALSPSGSSPQ